MMINQLEVVHELYDSIETMLSPDTLSIITGQSIKDVHETPLEEHKGLAGGTISYIDTNIGRYVLKRMSIESDFIMRASSDVQCRSVTLWQYGVLDEIQSYLGHEIIACSRDGQGFAILMNDLSGNVYAWDNQPTPEQTRNFIDRMVRYHAHFWNDERLASPEIGVCNSLELLEMSSLASAIRFADYTQSPIPEWIRDGWATLVQILSEDHDAQLRKLADDPQPLLDAINKFPKTLIHGDFRADNLAYTDYPIALDWQESGYTLCTVDLVWFLRDESFLPDMTREEIVAYYRESLETYLGKKFTDAEWQAMVDLGYCVDALRSIGFFGTFYSWNTDNPEEQAHHKQWIHFHTQNVIDALKWF